MAYPPDPVDVRVLAPAPVDHWHQDSRGKLHACYHKCRTSALSPGFWIGLTIGFFPEHLLWEKVPPFSLLTKLVGL